MRGAEATQKAITSALNDFKPRSRNCPLTEDDALVVYLAGEGSVTQNGAAFFSPADHPEDKDNRIIAFSTLKQHFSELRARHILLICDCCYSGGAVEGARRYESFLGEAMSVPSRKVLTSGALERTDDVGANELSTFTEALVQALERNYAPTLRSSSLFKAIFDPVNQATGQTPRYREFEDCGGQPEGEFIFFLNEDLVRQPLGFAPIDPPRGKKLTLADHLSRDVQEYYGWRRHAEISPCLATGPDEISSELELLEWVKSDPKPLIFAGEGGVGKTRLALELCRHAQSEGRDAMYLQSSAGEQHLQEILARSSETGQRLMLIIDYLERSDRDLRFDHIVEMVAEHSDRVRIVATCRESFFKGPPSLRPKRLNERDCFIFHMSPSDEGPYAQWLRGWVEAAYQHIDPASDAARSRVPAVAIIRKFARDLARGDALPESHGWMAELLMRSIRARSPSLSVSHSALARFLACFPMSDRVASGLLGLILTVKCSAPSNSTAGLPGATREALRGSLATTCSATMSCATS